MIPKPIAKKLKELIDGGEMSYPYFPNKMLLDEMEEDCVISIFVLGRKSSRIILNGEDYLRTFLRNRYLHFGDFDLSGMVIYTKQFRDKLAAYRCGYFIPPNVEELIKNYGNRELFERQSDRTKNIDFSYYPELAQLTEIIKRYKSGRSRNC